MEKKLDFLYAALEDTQRTILLMDRKCAMVFGVIVVMVGFMLVHFPEMVMTLYKSEINTFGWGAIASLVLALLILFCILWKLNKTLTPVSNPTEAFNVVPSIDFKFFHTPSDNGKFDFQKLQTQLTSLTDKNICDALLEDVLKTAFIRYRKIQNFKSIPLLVLVLFCLMTFSYLILLMLTTKSI